MSKLPMTELNKYYITGPAWVGGVGVYQVFQGGGCGRILYGGAR